MDTTEEGGQRAPHGAEIGSIRSITAQGELHRRSFFSWGRREPGKVERELMSHHGRNRNSVKVAQEKVLDFAARLCRGDPLDAGGAA